MARAEVTEIINRPVQAVFAYLIDIGKRTEWQGELVEARQTSSGPVGLGATIREVRRFMGKQVELEFKIVDYELDRKVSFESTSSPLPMRGYYSLAPVDGGAKVTFFVEAELNGVLKMAEPMVVHTAKRRMDADVARLKARLEA